MHDHFPEEDRSGGGYFKGKINNNIKNNKNLYFLGAVTILSVIIILLLS